MIKQPHRGLALDRVTSAADVRVEGGPKQVVLTSHSEGAMLDPFAGFAEWASEADEEAYREL